MNSDVRRIAERLAAPFAPNEIMWRVGQISRDGKKAKLLAYIDARAVMDRLDEVMGPANWRDSYREGPGGGVVCRLELRFGEEWVGREDVAANRDARGGLSEQDAVKSGFSDALKRAAVKWGVGRYLYRVEGRFQPIEPGWANGKGVDVLDKGKHLGHVRAPELPQWALPADDGASRSAAQRVQPTTTQDDAPRISHQDFVDQLQSIGFTLGEVKHILHQRGRGLPSNDAERHATLAWLSHNRDRLIDEVRRASG